MSLEQLQLLLLLHLVVMALLLLQLQAQVSLRPDTLALLVKLMADDACFGCLQ